MHVPAQELERVVELAAPISVLRETTDWSSE